MVLVDTSVLIDYFRGTKNEKVECFDKIILEGIPFGINNYIYLELLQGARDSKEFELLKAYLSTQKFYSTTGLIAFYENTAQLYRRCKKSGITVRSTIDVIIAQCAIQNHVKLLHNDRDFSLMASVVDDLNEYL